MEGFEDLCLIDTDQETVQKDVAPKHDLSYTPLSREPFGFLADDTPHSSHQIKSNIHTARMLYHYSLRDYQKSLNMALSFLADPENDKCGRSVLNQYHDTLVRCYLQFNQYSKAKEYCDNLIELCGHQDSDCWMVASILGFLSHDLKEGFRCLEKVVGMRNSNPNVWLLYATIMAHFYRAANEDLAAISDKLNKCNISRYFHKRWSDVLQLVDDSTALPTEHAYFYTICAVNNSNKLASAVYSQHNSKEYSEFSTWKEENYGVLRGILEGVEEEFRPYMEKNFNIIHFENWVDVNMTHVELADAFLKYSPYNS